MADDVQLNAATTAGAVIATDEISARNFQKVKLTFGADGTATDVDATHGIPSETLVGGAALTLGHGVAAGALLVELPTDGTGKVGLIAGTQLVGKVGIDQTTPGTTNAVSVGSSISSLPALVAGTALVGKVGIDQTTPGTTNAVVVTPPTSGGLSISKVIGAGSTNATSIKASAGQVFGWYISNKNAAQMFVKFYNKASAPTVGTDTPVMTLAIPGNATGVAANVFNSIGIAFSTGIAMAITTGSADNDNTGISAGDVIVNTFYK